MSTDDAKAYLSKREIPRLFECLMTGLMFHRPEDHIKYLVECLTKVQHKGQAEISWNMFVEIRSGKTPLPPITPENGKRSVSRPISRGRMTPKEDTIYETKSPLPPIGTIDVPDVPIIFVAGGPGSGKNAQANKLVEKLSGFVKLDIGELIRSEISDNASDEKWKEVDELVSNGELAPSHSTLLIIKEQILTNTAAKGFVVQGFPREIEQAKGFEKMVSRVDGVFLLDCKEETLRQNSTNDNPEVVSKKMLNFKEKTLPVLKYYDDTGKLFIIDGDKNEKDIEDEMFLMVESILQNTDNARIPTPFSPTLVRDDTLPEISEEKPRVPSASASKSPLPPIGSVDCPNVPIVFIAGGPGSGKAVQTKKLVESHSGWVVLDIGQMLRSEISNQGADDKWKLVKDLVLNGDLAPEDVTLALIKDVFSSNDNAKGFFVQGFPRDMEQSKAFDNMIAKVDAVFLLDTEEETLKSRVLARGEETGRLDDSPAAFDRRLSTYQEKTLPVLKHYDDLGKLYVFDGEKSEDEVYDEINILLETLLQSEINGRFPTPPVSAKPRSARKFRRGNTPTSLSREATNPPLSPAPPTMPEITYVPPPEIKVKDEGRKEGLPQAPIIFLAGGPGSGKGTQCAKIISRYPDMVHLSLGDILRQQITEQGSADEKWEMITKLLRHGEMAPTDVTEELLISAMKERPDAKAYLVEGYPRDALQYEEFNRNIGGHSFTILLDCEQKYLFDRLVLRGGSGNERIDDNLQAIEKKLSFFGRNTLPLMKSIDDEDKLIVMDGDRDEDEIFYDIAKTIDYSLYGRELEAQQPKVNEEEAKDGEEVAEEQQEATEQDQTATEVTEEQAATEVAEEQVATEVTEEQAATEVIEEQVETEVVEEQVATEISEEQVTAEATKQQATTEVTEEQSATEITEEQSAAEVAGEQAVTEVAEEQNATDIAEEQVATEVAEEQAATDVAEEQVAIEIAKEQAATEVAEEQGATEVAEEHAAAEVAEEQTGTEVAEEQAATEVAEEQAAAEVAEEQTGTEVAEEQAATEVAEEQTATEVAEEQTATEVAEEQAATEVAEEQAAAEVMEETQEPEAVPPTEVAGDAEQTVEEPQEQAD